MHRIGPLSEGLPNSDQQTGGERDGQPACIGQGAQPHSGILIRAAVVGLAAGLKQAARRGLQHHAHRRRDRLEPGQLRPTHHARVQVRQQPGLLQHPDPHGAHIGQGRVVATFVEPLPGLRPPRLGPVAQGEQRLLTTEFGAPSRDIDDLIGLEVHTPAGGLKLARHRDERAVVADISAEVGDRDEHLARVGHRQPTLCTAAARRLKTRVAHPGRTGTQIDQIITAGSHRDGGLIDIEGNPVTGPSQHPPQ